MQTNFIYIKSFFITVPLNDASVDFALCEKCPNAELFLVCISFNKSVFRHFSCSIVDDEDFFEFSHKAKFKSPLCVHITIDTEAESLHTTDTGLKIC